MNQQLPVALPPEPEAMPLADMLRLVNRYRWHVVAIAALFAVLGTISAFSATPVYRATATVLVEGQPNRVVQVEEVYNPGYGSYEYYGTQIELMRSRDLAGRVVDRLELARPPAEPAAAEPGALARFLSLHWLPFLPQADPEDTAPLSPEQLRERAIGALQEQTRVDLVPRTQLMRVTVESPSPAAAAAIANALGDAYVDSGLDSRLQATERATRWLSQRMADLRGKLESAEHALQAYREKHQLVNVGGARGLYEDEVTDNSRKLREAQTRKTQLGSTYWKIQQAGNDPARLQEISALLLDAPVQRAGDNLLQAEQAVKQLEERYGEKHPQMTAARARLDGARRAYDDALLLAANGVKAEYEIAAETERALGSVVESGREQIRRLDQQDYQLRVLEREVQSTREVYDLFLKRFKETDTDAQYGHLNARVVDPAIEPARPFKPNKPRVVTTWTLAGVLLALALIALRHMLSETVRSPEHLEQATQLPVLAALPRVPGFARRVTVPSLVMDQPRAPFSEGVRSIRASLHLSDVDKRMKRILFTSAVAGEGKSSLAAGFAVTLGQAERVLLLEADLRAPQQKKIFGIPAQNPGLVDVLTGQARLEQALYRHGPSGAWVLPVATTPANPVEVVASAAFLKLIEALAAKFDRIVFDSPPCAAGSDSVLLAHRMDTVVFVIHAARTSVRAIQAAVRQLRSAHAPLLGHVLNQVDAHGGYGYGPLYAYGYGYGYGAPRG